MTAPTSSASLLPVEFFVRGLPKSAQAKNQVPWRQRVRAAARDTLPPENVPTRIEVALHVVCVHAGERPMDVDNMVKPIADGLNGVVYEDDGQLTDLYAAMRRMEGMTRFEDPSAVLVSALESGTDFVLVRIDRAPVDAELPWRLA